MPTIAEYLAKTLQDAGVERVFGLPGGENVAALEAMRKRGIDFVLVANESSACYMAATEARLSGGIGVALTTLGPGATNACAGLAHAHLDRAPVLLLTAASDPALAGKHTHQALDLNTLFAPICKFSAELNPQKAAARIAQALRTMRMGRPGPAHLSIPNSLADLEIADSQSTAAAARVKLPSSASAAQICDLLAQMRRPIIVAGLGLEPGKPYSQLRQFAESLDAPVIDTPKGKGALSAAHPLFAGTIGLTRQDPAYALLDEADCIIALGFDVVELVKPWAYQTPLVWIAEWENNDPPIHSAIEIVGDIAATIEALLPVQAATASDWGAARVRRYRRHLAERELPSAAPGRILPQAFLQSLRQNTPDDIIVCTDVGSHKIFAALEWQARAPNRYFVSNGLSAMGFGLTSAIAAAEITGEPVVCITGDAGLAMVMGELGMPTARGLRLLVAVMNDSALDLIRAAQWRSGNPAFGTEFVNPDYAHVAAAYGLGYWRVQSRADCDAGIRRWLAQDESMLLDVMLDPAGYPTAAARR